MAGTTDCNILENQNFLRTHSISTFIAEKELP